MYATLSPRQQAWVDSTFARLTLREKIGQTQQERFSGFPDDRPETIECFFAEAPYGSLFCGGEIIKGAGSSADTQRAGLALCQKWSKTPLLVAGDLESGAGAAVKSLTTFPSMMALGATHNAQTAYDYGRWTATEGRAAGFTWTFAPVVDLLRNWLNPVVSNRCLGDDAQKVLSLATAVIRGMQENGLCACAKHFPGDGVDFRDQHLITSINSLSEEDWFATFGRVFQGAIDAGVYSIMIGHIALPWLEPIAPGARRVRPATVSRKILQKLLRERMGFEGVIVSDALEMAGITGWAPYAERTIEAFNAGVDVMLWPGKRYLPLMEEALREGKVSEERLEESVRRILSLKARLGLCDLAEDGSDPQAAPLSGPRLAPELDSQVRAATRDVAEQSITLVRNERQLLPLDPAKIKRVLLHAAVNPATGRKDSVDLLAERLQARGIEVTRMENGNCVDLWTRERAGERWDAYLVVFSLQIHQAKNTVRPFGEMAEVMWTLQNTDTTQPIVISQGTPFLLHDMPFLHTLVNTYSPSEGSQTALERALFGEIPFAGTSPVNPGGEWV
ncbi:MAG: glycoside hydrolase family 3 protein [Chthoniobacteraceae bacterium]